MSETFAFHYAGFDWLPLLESNREALERALDDEVAAPRLAAIGGVARRWQRDVAGESFTLVIEEGGRVLGWAGVLDYPGRPEVVQSSTFLGVEGRGGRVNPAAKMVIWTMAEILERRLILSCDATNVRSVRAIERFWPGIAGVETDQPWFPRRGLIFEPAGAPCGAVMLGAGQRDALERAMVASPFGRRLGIE